MNVTGDEHRRMVDALLALLEAGEPVDGMAIIGTLAKIAPHGKREDLDRAWADAEGIWHERIEVEQAEITALKRFFPLFDDAPDNVIAVEWAREKAQSGDQLAREFLDFMGAAT